VVGESKTDGRWEQWVSRGLRDEFISLLPLLRALQRLTIHDIDLSLPLRKQCEIRQGYLYGCPEPSMTRGSTLKQAFAPGRVVKQGSKKASIASKECVPTIAIGVAPPRIAAVVPCANREVS
jgi:hypothetical protein